MSEPIPIDLVRLRRSCADCSLGELCLPAGVDRDDLGRLDTMVQRKRPLQRGESLFRAGIGPDTPAGRLSPVRCTRLANAVKATLEASLAAGGSTLRDFIHSDGASGWFQQAHYVYGREGEPCRVCGAKVRALRLGQRSTFLCPRCQR